MDEPMLMNFDIGDEATIKVKPVVKGGRWRERASIKKSFTKVRRKIPGTGVNAEAVAERPSKRQKIDQNIGKNSSKTNTSREVISSLFTFNPESKVTHEKVDDTPKAEPSNAPLIDGIDTFTSIGLSPMIATHLLTKLHLKAPTAIQRATVSQLLAENSDAFIQAETGSGKTLAYLLPIIHRLTEMSEKMKKMGTEDKIHRDSGLFAIILAPTRELCKQISVVLDTLLGCARWIVSGTVLGGEKKKSEKARLRKGLNILVATPGRLVDHLQHTEVLDVSAVRWLVLDEGDRLMELGFEEDIKMIVSKLEQQNQSERKPIPGLPSKRTTILCSATLKRNVEKLGEISLKDAVHIKADTSETETNQENKEAEFSVPAQLQQSWITVPAKQRLVTLYSLLKRTFARKGSVMKAIVFLSCADSVDFHYEVLGRELEDDNSKKEDAVESSNSKTQLPTTKRAPLLCSLTNPNLSIYKLHGSLAQPIRTATLNSFSRNKDPSILLCTDVASRGLDLPSIDLVIEYDPAFSAEDHLHRIGRTARAGRDGRAVIFLMPGPEENYVSILKNGFKDGASARLLGSSAEDTLRKGFAPASGANNKTSWEDAATDWQLDVERWIQQDKKAAEMARKAYVSHVRAYATHVVPERHIFDVKELHLGHLAKAFALRDKPSNMGRAGKSKSERPPGKVSSKRPSQKGGDGDGDNSDVENAKSAAVDRGEAARKMRMAMRAMGGASEFNIG
jgi:ATP-dependent RNA helicase DDX31/DBP7